MFAGAATRKMNSKRFVEEGSFKPLTGVELHSLSREERSSQDEHDMAVLGRAQELNVSTNKPSLGPRYKIKLTLNSAIFVLFQRWDLHAR